MVHKAGDQMARDQSDEISARVQKTRSMREGSMGKNLRKAEILAYLSFPCIFRRLFLSPTDDMDVYG